MAKQRVLNTKFWSDNFVVNINPLDRYLFIYFLTNEKTELCGIYELPLRTAANETGIDQETLKVMLKTLEPKIYYIDGWVYARNFAKHQADNPSVQKGIERSRALIPPNILAKIDLIERKLTGTEQGTDTLHTGSDSLSTPCDIPKPELKPKPIPNGIAPTEVVAIASKAKKEKKPPIEYTPEMLEQRLTQMEQVEGSALDIIATYIREKPVKITNSKQLSLVIARFSRIAKAAEGAYTNKQLFEAIGEIKKENQERSRKGEAPIDWTVETVIKKLIKK